MKNLFKLFSMIFIKIHRKIFLPVTALLIFMTVLYISMVTLNDEVYFKAFRLEQQPSKSLHYESYNSPYYRLDYDVDMKEIAIAFIKIMKCASTSLSQLLLRLAYERDLKLALPLSGKIYIGWPYPPKRSYILDPSGGRFYHIFCDHAIYDRSFFDSIMFPNTKYITSLRHPYAQLKSTVNYFNVLNISKVPHLHNESERFRHLMYNLECYDEAYRSPNSSRLRYCIPDHFSMTKNLMSFSLGFPFLGGFDLNATNYEGGNRFCDGENVDLKTYLTKRKVEKSKFQYHVDKWLAKLDREMDLILIVEWLPESLVLMKRMFSLTMKDILVLDSNVLSYDFKTRNSMDSLLESIYQSWSWIDYELYNHFTTSLWKKLNSQPVSFWGEVDRLKEILISITKFCSGKPGNVKLKIEESAWNDAFEVDSTLCLSRDQYSDMLRERYEKKLKREYFQSAISSAGVEGHRNFC